MSTLSKMAVKGVPLNPVAQAQTEAAEDKRPPGGTEAGTAAVPKKIFVCSPYRPTAENLRCQKSQLEANIDRAKTACRILSTLGFLPLAPHLYFTQFLKDEENRYSQTLTVIPLTSKMKKLELPTHVVLTKEHCEMLKAEQMEDSVLLIEQITTIDRSALYSRLCRVTSAEKKQEIERAVARQFDMKQSAENTTHHHDGKEV